MYGLQVGQRPPSSYTVEGRVPIAGITIMVWVSIGGFGNGLGCSSRLSGGGYIGMLARSTLGL